MGRFVFAVCVMTLTACASTERDTRYIHSIQGPPLQIPAGMDTPNYNPQMKMPNIAGQESKKIDSSFTIERPPQLEDTE